MIAQTSDCCPVVTHTHLPMDQEHCSTLDNMVSTYADASKFTDTLPSISIDDNSSLSDNDFFLKEHYDKIDKLRKENFDLKLKLYLLESNEKITNDSGMILCIFSVLIFFIWFG